LDTGTHLVVGLGLAGLAYIDPVVAADSSVSTAVLIGTVVGSQAPDFDGFLRLKSNASYIKNHRGMSHSLPAIAIWTLLITMGINMFFENLPLLHVGLWVLIAVCLHVFSDLFNTYGTQALRPFTQKWISWNIIHIFDPVIFFSHLVAILLWSFYVLEPQQIFPPLYILLAIYYVWRTVQHYVLQKRLPAKDPHYRKHDTYTLIPTFHLHIWNVVKHTEEDEYVLGEYKNGRIQWVDRVKCANHSAVEASKHHPDIASFLYFSTYPCAEIKHHKWGYEVRWFDVRYRHRKQYPFVGVLLMDQELKPLDSYVGWLSDTRLEKKLRVNTY
jgi:inner membrane protein